MFRCYNDIVALDLCLFTFAFQTHNENLLLKFHMSVLKFMNLACNAYLLVLQINLVYGIVNNFVLH